MKRHSGFLAVFGLALPALGLAQSVRGVVTDDRSAPIAGVVVQLLDVHGTAVARALSDETGAYRVLAPASGVYRIRTQRIGFRPSISEAMELRGTEELSRAVVVRGLPFSLDTLRVTGRSACRVSSDTAAATFALWEQVRTAITAASVTVSEKDVGTTILTYERSLDPSFRRVNSQSTKLTSGMGSRAWRTLPPDSLHRAGYVFVGADGWTTYFAPDLEVLLSPSFLDDHCFRLAESDDKRLVGLEFEPIRARPLADIRGWMWLERTTAELQSLEYRYTNIRAEQENANAGGTLKFKRLGNGAWVITRWDIRMPSLTETNENLNAGIPGAAVARRVRVTGMKVSGGELALVTRRGDTLWSHPPLTISGSVTDTIAQRGVARATLELRGTSIHATADSAGAFRLDGILPGEYTMVVRTPSLDSIGVTTELTMTVLDRSLVVPIRLENLSTWVDRLCGQALRRSSAPVGMVVGTVRLPDSLPAVNLPIVVEWSQAVLNGELVGQHGRRVETTTDARGVFRACGVPIDTRAVVRSAWDAPASAPREVRIADGTQLAQVAFTINKPVASAASLSGRVTDTTDTPLDGVEVVLVEANLVGKTSPSGEYRIGSIPPSMQTVIVRRVGYKPTSSQLVFGRNDAVTQDFTIRKDAVRLDTFVVAAGKRSTEFEEGRKRSSGSFVSREDLAKQSSRRLSEVLRVVSGARIWHSSSNDAWMAGGRAAGQQSIMNPEANALTELDPMDVAKGAKPDCYSDVWLDNTLVYAGRQKEPLFNVNSLSPDEVESIEYYAGPAQTPVRYSRPNAKCGVLVIHTRR